MPYKCECLECPAKSFVCTRRKITLSATAWHLCNHGGEANSPVTQERYQQAYDEQADLHNFPPERPVATLAIGQVAPVRLVAVPRVEWPADIVVISLLANAKDRGIGDTIKRELGIVGSTIAWAFRMIGVTCGCDGRQATLNAKYPYLRSDS